MISIKIKFKGIELEGTIEEIKELKMELDELLGDYTGFPYIPPFPSYPYDYPIVSYAV